MIMGWSKTIKLVKMSNEIEIEFLPYMDLLRIIISDK